MAYWLVVGTYKQFTVYFICRGIHLYSVCVDGHHKLIRWRLVTHGGIDGYSRMVVYLKCSSNNRSATVYSLFLEAVRQYGLPSRVRSDQGRENYKVAQHMIEHRGAERRSMITGNSVHNQRIERFWRDLHYSVTNLFYRLFYHMEYINILDPASEQHLYALHYVYIPRINTSLSLFRAGWNNHRIRTVHNLSPEQLFTAGVLRLQRSGLVALDFLEDYGIDEDGLPTTTDENSGVEVPEGNLSLDSEQLTNLQRVVDPLQESNNYGIDVYEEALLFLNNL